MKNNIRRGLLLLAGLLFVLSAGCLAKDRLTAQSTKAIPAKGTSNKVSWSIDKNGKLTISGSGNYKLSEQDGTPWSEYREWVKSAQVNVSGMTDASYLLSGCKNLTTVTFGSKWSASGVKYFTGMFSECSSLKSLDLSKWDTASAEDCSVMFAYCSSLTSLNLSKWNTKKVENAFFMFSGCKNLSKLDLTGWNTASFQNAYGLFSDCIKLNCAITLSNETLLKDDVFYHAATEKGSEIVVNSGGGISEAVLRSFIRKTREEGTNVHLPDEVLAEPVITNIARCANGAKVIWNPVQGAQKYRILRRTTKGTFKNVGETTELFYLDEKATNGTSYFYSVQCIRADGKSTTSSYELDGSKNIWMAPLSIIKIEQEASKLRVSYTSGKNATGYQIQYAGKSDFSDAKNLTVSGRDSLTAELNELSKGTWYIRVRCYRKSSGIKYYSTWSAKKKSVIK